ncbi:hypothetical protein KBY93_14920 [Synechococcus sp. J7-Johnson]|uniref:hypothetical protein n=1 Tax=Synechococcus sp. J7-Johnson TaxID=2823737 RepID=UPI0020CBD6CE|nr:hypothetical protein [Synechococcus sp. J7-Johnson]MCP9841908.1 hypothetical protein [Synechococcus sp. J7-Johnson]
MRLSFPITLALGFSLMAAGCQQNSQKTELKVEKKICTQLERVGQALEMADALTPQSTVGEAQKVRKELRDSMRALAASETKLEKIRYAQFEQQGKDFRGEIRAIKKDSSMTLEQAATTLKERAQPLIAAHKALKSGVNCP